MTWKPIAPPKGWVLSVLNERDSLASLATETGIKAEVIAEANGVTWPGRKTCVWGRDIADWVLSKSSTGIAGFRRPASSTEPNNCESGKGHVSFSTGQSIALPLGVRPPAPGGSAPPPKTKPKSNKGAIVAAIALVAAIVGPSLLGGRKKATA